jgi:hypothetical protein
MVLRDVGLLAPLFGVAVASVLIAPPESTPWPRCATGSARAAAHWA